MIRGLEDILEFNIDRVMKQLAEQPKVIREMEFCFFDANIQCFVENLRADGSMTMVMLGPIHTTHMKLTFTKIYH